ncbi:alkaline phosphatase family protein [Aggregatimonas sangjinii]|uniref:Alkaline phosphatase family protein n=1 Tax=Aggregatimonas sangjinii TaxID=2583587 RepID=A0A5B7SUE6_9FLAO|nr:alkaline phosphatase D family protein [Aggregatimonas sangjinii]QCX00491.1 alkaline phosphatase family protein [Aggregatimonas sangjinii]
MKKTTILFGALFFLIGCKSSQTVSENENTIATEPLLEEFTIAFGSCNRTDLPNLLWDDILAIQPDLWLWGGDNIYADTDDMQQLRSMYRAQDQIAGYRELKSKTPVLGTWDDHDYGLNDGGVEFTAKKESQQEFLNFMNVPEDSPRRMREGIYAAQDLPKTKGMVKVIVLDTRYFRTAVTPDTETAKRLKPNKYGEGTVLGSAQWQWFEKELRNSKAEFNIVVSSIQLLSNEHGFEGWGNFPHEVDRFKRLVSDSKAKGVIVLSGDRHISEFSKTEVDGLSYPLIDFTSSGLTHAYRGFTGEPNPFRVGEVIFTESFGTLYFDLQEKKVLFKIIGDGGIVLGSLEQQY